MPEPAIRGFLPDIADDAGPAGVPRAEPLALQALLRDLFRTTRPVALVPASSGGMMEAAIRNGVQERVLVVIGGEDGARFAGVAESCGKDVVRAMVPPGRTLEAEHLAQFLDGPEVDAVALVHAETSTGALAPLSDLARVVHARKDVHLLVDTTGSLGASPVETDGWQLDFAFSSSEKGLALPPGLGLGVASSRLLARAANLPGRGRYFDLVRLSQAAGETGFPEILPHTDALAARLEQIRASGGLEARWKRHHEMLNLVEEWVLLRPPFQLLAPEGRRSWSVSCLRLPPGLVGDEVVQAMRAKGWRIGTGWGDLRISTLRIGHMGEATPADLSHLLSDLGEVTAAKLAPSM